MPGRGFNSNAAWALVAAAIGLGFVQPALAQRASASTDEAALGVPGGGGTYDGDLGDRRMSMEERFADYRFEQRKDEQAGDACRQRGCVLLVNKVPDETVTGLYVRKEGNPESGWRKNLFEDWKTRKLRYNQGIILVSKDDPAYCKAEVRMVLEKKDKQDEIVEGDADLCKHPGDISKLVAQIAPEKPQDSETDNARRK